MDDFKRFAYPVLVACFSIATFLAALYATSGNAAYWWDEAEYGILSRSLTASGFFGYFGAQSFRPPFLPEYIAIGRALIGENAWTYLIPLFSGLCVASIFIVSKRLFGILPAFLAAAFLASSSLFIFYSGRMLTEIPGLFYTILTAFFLFRCLEEREGQKERDFILLGLFTLMGLLVFYRFFLVLFSLGVYAAVFRGKDLIKNARGILIAAAVFLIGMIPLFAYANTYYGGPLGIFLSTYNAGEAVGTNYFISLLPHIFSNLFVVLLIFLSIIYAFLYGKPAHRYLALVSIIMIIGASLLLSHKEDRYIMPIYASVFMLAGAFASEALMAGYRAAKGFSVGEAKESQALKIIIGAATILLFYFATFGNFSNVASLYEQGRLGYGDVKAAALFVRDSALPGEVIMTDSVTAIFHSGMQSKGGFNAVNLTAFLLDLERAHPAYLIITAYESREYYGNAINNFRTLKVATNSVEYVLLHPEKFEPLRAFPSDSNALVLAFRVKW